MPGSQTLQGQPEVDELLGLHPVRREEDAGGPLPAHHGREQEAAGRLRRHAELGEGDAQAGAAVDEHEVAVGQHGEAQPDRHAVDRGEQRHRDVAEALEQALEAPIGPLDLGAGRDAPPSRPGPRRR